MNSFKQTLHPAGSLRVRSVHSKNLMQVPKINFQGEPNLGWVHLKRNLCLRYKWQWYSMLLCKNREGWLSTLLSLRKKIILRLPSSYLCCWELWKTSEKLRSWHSCRERRIKLATYQHCKWKAAGQWSQHRRSPPSRQLSQVSWLVALPLLRDSLSGFRFFSPSSDFGGASSVCICWKWIDWKCFKFEPFEITSLACVVCK